MSTYIGTAGNDKRTGTSSADSMDGRGGDDSLVGGAGNDTLIGGIGNDTLKGGAGNDTYVVDSTHDVLTETLGAGTDLVQSSVNWTLGSNFEQLVLTGNANLAGTGNTLDNTVTGNSGRNTLDGGTGNDSLDGGAGNDSLIGGAGNDTLVGGTGNDTLKGGAGDDTYVVAAGDSVTEASGAGTDLVKASVTWVLGNNIEKLTLTGSANINGTGNALTNTITGNAGNNILDGGTGNDVLKGAGGNDTYIVSAGDTVTELLDGGTDLVKASSDWTLGNNLENLTLTGGAIPLSGTGNGLNNVITGNSGDNLLDGGAGSDQLFGEEGNDTLVWDAADASIDGGADTDTLRVDGSEINFTTTSVVVQNIDVIELAGSVTLTLSEASLSAIASSLSLRVDGGGDDNVIASGGWTQMDDQEETYALYVSGGLSLLVDLDIDRSGINLVPAGGDGTVVATQDTPYTFSAGDFDFSDANGGDTLAAVRIDGLPASGSLELNGDAVSEGQVVSLSDIEGNLLVFTPASGESGIGYASFTFSVQDSADAFDPTPNTLTVDVAATSGNNLPTGADHTITVPEDAAFGFGAADFGFSDLDGGDTLQAVRIDTLPLAGTLELSSVAVTEGQVIAAGSLGSLVFTPAANANGASYASFTFSVQDSQGGYDETPNTITVDVTAVNDAPVAADDTLSSVAEDSGLRTISFASLTGNDADGDAEVTQALTITGVSNAAGGTVAINAGHIEFTPTANFNGTAYFDYTLSDGSATDTGGVSFAVTAVNDAPVAADDALSSVAEDSGLRTISFASLTGNDADGDAEVTQALTITAVSNAVGGTVAINGSNVEFTPTANFNGAASFDYTLRDNGQTNGSDDFKTDTGAVSFAVTAVNDAPVVDVNGAPSYALNAAAVVLDSTITLTDVDSTNLTGATVTVSNFQSGDTLGFVNQLGITGNYSSGVLTLSGTTTKANYETALESVTFSSSSGNSTDRTVSFTVTDGTDTSAADTATVDVSAGNAAPVVSVDTAPVFYTGTSWSVILDAAITITDTDNSTLAGATVRVVNFQSGDLLEYSNQLGISGSYNSSTGVLTLSGTTTLANYEYALESVGFYPAGDSTDRVVEFKVNDGASDSVADTVTVDIQAGSGAIPTIAVDGTAYYALGSAGVVIDPTITLTDTDSANLAMARVTVTGFQSGDALNFSDQLGIVGHYNASTGVLTLTGSASKANYETALESVTFSSSSSVQSNRTVGFLVSDGYGVSTNDTVSINIQPAASATLKLSSIDGTNGFQLMGEPDSESGLGTSVSSAGDVNGDGFDDIIIGAHARDVGFYHAGESYVIFGKADFSGEADGLYLANIGSLDGFTLIGGALSIEVGSSVSGAGDINGDGYDDLIVAGLGGAAAGASYVVFGGSSLANRVASALNGTTGFKIVGETSGDAAGTSVSGAGDINGDGYDDLIVGAQFADPNALANAGQSYVVFGKAGGFGSVLDLSSLNGTTGFQINGKAAGDLAGISVSSAGDVNGDGFDDLLVGAYKASPGAVSQAGASYLVFGKGTAFTSNLELSTLNGTTGFEIRGETASDWSGYSVSGAGDVNGDGRADMIISAHQFGASNAGAAYVVFGASSFGSILSLSSLNGTTGFQVNGRQASDGLGNSVSSAGDVNGDGYDDLLIGAQSADPGAANAGATYVLFGKASGFASNIDLTALDATMGFQINGETAADQAGTSVSGAGDVNGDGFDDLIVGATGFDLYGSNDGAGYVVFGRDFRGDVDFLGTSGNNSLTGTGTDDVMVGGLGNDTLTGGSGNDVLKGGAGHDVAGGDAGNDRIEGDAGNDSLDGGADFDRLYGDEGNDTLDGGTGNDTLTGGGDNDAFLFNDALGASNVDTIMDFGGAGTPALDVIQLENAVFTALGAGALSAASFKSGVSPVADADDRILYDTATGELYYDADGSGAGAAVKFAVIAADPDGLAASDFSVI